MLCTSEYHKQILNSNSCWRQISGLASTMVDSSGYDLVLCEVSSWTWKHAAFLLGQEKANFRNDRPKSPLQFLWIIDVWCLDVSYWGFRDSSSVLVWLNVRWHPAIGRENRKGIHQEVLRQTTTDRPGVLSVTWSGNLGLDSTTQTWLIFDS